MERFLDWVKSRKQGPVMPQGDKVHHLIQQAGPQGISRGELEANVKLEPETLDSMIQALVDFGRVVVSMESGYRIYRSR